MKDEKKIILIITFLLFSLFIVLADYQYNFSGIQGRAIQDTTTRAISDTTSVTVSVSCEQTDVIVPASGNITFSITCINSIITRVSGLTPGWVFNIKGFGGSYPLNNWNGTAPTASEVDSEISYFELTTVNDTTGSTYRIYFNLTQSQLASISSSNIRLFTYAAAQATKWPALSTTVLDGSSDPASFYASVSDFDKFLIGEIAQEEVAPPTVIVSGGGGGGSGGGTLLGPERIISIEILTPGPVQLYTDERAIVIPFEVKNTGTTDLEGVNLTAMANDIFKLTLSKKFINLLEVSEGENHTILLRTEKNITAGAYEIELTATVTNPNVSDTAKIFINLLERGASNRTYAEDRLIFAKELLQDNPECLELDELLERAAEELEKGNYEKAIGLIDFTINTCKSFISGPPKKIEKPSKLSIDWGNIIWIIISILVGLLFIIALIYSMMRPEEDKKPKQTETKEESIAELPKQNPQSSEEELGDLLSKKTTPSYKEEKKPAKESSSTNEEQEVDDLLSRGPGTIPGEEVKKQQSSNQESEEDIQNLLQRR